MMIKNICKIELSLFLSVVFILMSTGCSEKISVEFQKYESEELKSEFVIPTYTDYSEFSSYMKEILTKDFQDYKNYSEMEWRYGNHTTFNYKTSFEDRSNSRYINAIIKELVYAGENIQDEYFITFNYDKKMKQFVTVTDITQKSLNQLSDICFSSIMNSVQNLAKNERPFVEDCVRNGTMPVESSFSSFIADKKYITIIFSAGSTLSTYYGTQYVKVSY